MQHLKTTAIPAIVGDLGMIEKGTDKRINKIPASPSQCKIWVCRIHRLHVCRGVRPPPADECPDYDTKQSDGEVPVMLGLWRMRSTP